MSRKRQDIIGGMDRRITIELYVPTRGEYGQEILTWKTHIETWAKVSYKMGGSKEGEEAKRETSTDRVVFFIRYQKSLSPLVNAKMRVLFDGGKFDIMNVQERTDLGRKCFMDLIAEIKEATE